MTADGAVLDALHDAAAEFRRATSARALLDQGPEAIARLGFDRVLVSRIDDGVWLPESMFVRSDPQWAAAIVRTGQEEPVTVDAVVEADVAGSARRLVVDEVQTHPRVSRPIAVISRSDNYGVVPIVVDDAVIGMVHVDCYFQQRRVRTSETLALGVAVDCFAAHLGRHLLVERLQALSREPAALWSSGPPRRMEADPCPLTGRELDVMRLMAAGRTNYQIAHGLDVSEGTVKTHVSSILRKLDAANRAQAVAVWQGR